MANKTNEQELKQNEELKTTEELKQNEELKVSEEVSFDEMINQLRESILIGIKNIEKEIRQNELLLNVITKEKVEELKDVEEQLQKSLTSLNASLEKMKEHSKYSVEILEEVKDEKVANTVAKLLKILIRR